MACIETSTTCIESEMGCEIKERRPDDEKIQVFAQRLRCYRPPPPPLPNLKGEVVENDTDEYNANVINSSNEHFVSGGKRRAAVLVCLFEGTGGDLRVILTKRSMNLSSHPGEVALPGGKKEEGDADDSATALREAMEEIGLHPALIQVVANLEPFISQVCLPLFRYAILGFALTEAIASSAPMTATPINSEYITIKEHLPVYRSLGRKGECWCAALLCRIGAVRCAFNGFDFISALCKSKPSIVKMKSELLITEINGSYAHTKAPHQHYWIPLETHQLIVVPVVGLLPRIGDFKPSLNPDEVDAIFDAPLEMFLKEDRHRFEEREWGHWRYTSHIFNFETEEGDSFLIAGLTASILIRTASLIYQRSPAFSDQRLPDFQRLQKTLDSVVVS